MRKDARASGAGRGRQKTQAGGMLSGGAEKSPSARGGSEPGKSEAAAFCVIRMRRSEQKNGDTITVIE